MNKIIETAIIILAIVVIFVAGIFIGFISAKNMIPASVIKPQTQTQAQAQNPAQPAAGNLLNNPLISTIFAAGRLISISGSTVNIGIGTSTLAVATDTNTKVVTYGEPVKDAKGNISPVTENISLSDLKPGDYIATGFKLSLSGQPLAITVTKLLPISSPTPAGK